MESSNPTRAVVIRGFMKYSEGEVYKNVLERFKNYPFSSSCIMDNHDQLRTHTVITFYKYIPVSHPEKLRVQLRGLCAKLDIKGRILLGKEGLNGGVCGTREAINVFKKEVKHISGLNLNDLAFREQHVNTQVYHKLVVRVRDEIVVFGKQVDLKNKGEYITPQELKAKLDAHEDIVLLDMRNDYEFEVGRFKGAKVFPVKAFNEVPACVERGALQELKNKQVITYCTGGIRCEKASAFLKEQGFKHVKQLHGGIINYVNQFPDTYYEGSCFVFDDRNGSKVSKKNVGKCELCEASYYKHVNCHNLECDKLFISCETCQEKMNKTCSEACKSAPRQRKGKHAEKTREYQVIGRVENYYAQAGVVLVKVEKGLARQDRVGFVGYTTPEFIQGITMLKDYDGNIIEKASPGQLVTFPVNQKVREHDHLVLPV
jgi:UPF0176 protein